MNRPYMICHILSTLDGKINGKFFSNPSVRMVSRAYAKVRTEINADAWIYGTITTQEFVGSQKPTLSESLLPVPDGDYIAQTNSALYYVSIDTEGEIAWESGNLHLSGRPVSHVIEVLTEKTPLAYRAYLREKGVSYILAGDTVLDCQIAAEKLYQLFGIKTALICGGGKINWTFLQQGMIDELSLLLAPIAEGNPDSASVFEWFSESAISVPVEFQLDEVERLPGNGLWLRYFVRR